jgi:hypothetical protein
MANTLEILRQDNQDANSACANFAQTGGSWKTNQKDLMIRLISNLLVEPGT